MELFKKLSFGNFVTVTYYTTIGIVFAIISLSKLDISSQEEFISSLKASSRNIILFIIAILCVLRMVHCWMANINSFKYRFNLQNTERIIMKSGLPGCGKSSSGAFEAKFLAIFSWASLRVKYFCLLYEFNKKGKLSEDKEFKLCLYEKAYNFYIKNIEKYIPCLYSNMRIRVGHRKSYDLFPEHLLQLKCLPYGSVCFIDEIGKVLNSDLFRYDKDGIIEEMYRLSRHFGFWFVGTEQDYHNVFIGVRRDCSYNEVIQRQKACFKPFIISFVKKAFDKVIIDRNKDKYLCKVNSIENVNLYDKVRSKLFIKIYIFNNKLYNLFGYRYYKSKLVSNTEVNGVSSKASEKGRNKRYYIPSNLTLYYNDTYCSSLYKRLNDDIELNEKDTDSNLAKYDFKNKVMEIAKDSIAKVKLDNDVDAVKKKKIARLEAVDEYKEKKKLSKENKS